MRLTAEQLFDADLRPIGDATLDRLLTEAERRCLSGYRAAVAEEMLYHPERTLSQLEPLETV